ncbi:GDSL-type esterase/lipase family protein [Dactylosporangium maewongense]|uniref:GDSL-type esterase/lipase family protein n=1 Tax=Dactylosporangium maewongense TaxID=634393 RepID=A0ABN2AC88_9ACTN
MSVFRRTALVVAGVLVSAGAAVVPALPAAAALPTAAVALGDSFISGEGAGSYQPVVDVNGVAQPFPGWSAPNTNAFFCHRSANASLNQAALPGIQARFNLACSGGRPHDIANPSGARDKGRSVAAQLDQLRAVAQTHDIDLVLIGLGSNNSSFTFGDVAEKCANRFIADAWTGWWEFWAYLNGPVEQEPCTAADLATAAQVQAATAETIAAARQIIATLDQIDADGQHRVVFQDYTNPLPLDLDQTYWEEDGRQDDRDKFRDLGAERYAAGCPIHRASLAPGHGFSQGLGTIVRTTRDTLAAEFPGDDLVYLDVQHAFDGARLCERSGSPGNALATPIRLQDGASGVFVTSLAGKDKIAIQRIANTCVTYFQTCQESWHPSAAGHAVLGKCLTGAATATARTVTCTRKPDGTIVTA